MLFFYLIIIVFIYFGYTMSSLLYNSIQYEQIHKYHVAWDKMTAFYKKRIQILCNQSFPNSDTLFYSKSYIMFFQLGDNIIACAALLDNKYLNEFFILQGNKPPKINNIDGVFLYNFCVHPQYRNQGIGKKLLQYVLEEMNSIHKNIELQVLADNIPALSIYEKQGFLKTNVHFDQFRNKHVYTLESKSNNSDKGL